MLHIIACFWIVYFVVDSIEVKRPASIPVDAKVSKERPKDINLLRVRSEVDTEKWFHVVRYCSGEPCIPNGKIIVTTCTVRK